MNLSITDWAAVVQAAGAIFTTVGVPVSIYFSAKALREVQLDRRLRQQPHMQFERGGYTYPIALARSGKRIRGINPKAVETLFPTLADDAVSVDLDFIKNANGSIKPFRVGKLKNFGLGPALHARVIWVPQTVYIHGEPFEIDERKLKEPLYRADLNTLPCIPANVLPGEQGGLSRLPTFVNKDVDQKLSRIDGFLRIVANDVFRQEHETHQEFSIFMEYKGPHPTFHVSFGDSLPVASAA